MRVALVAGATALTLSACGTTNWGFPYKMDVQQGNWITSEQVAQLRKGMTPDQVRFILGSPTLHDVLHADRWDYPYLNEPGYGKREDRNFTVWFKNGLLDHWKGDAQPDRQPFQKTDTGAKAIEKSGSGAGAPGSGTAGASSENAKTGATGTESGQAAPVNSSSYHAPTNTLKPGIAPANNTTDNHVSRQSDLLLKAPAPITDPSAGGATSQPLR
ncbi:MAG TPA: outer membrane protein assembly factor BamE [Burkholderiaceae bacterium]|nr:outer membrane protein assembly factor BamE [Burkholderiaceae bacterium]